MKIRKNMKRAILTGAVWALCLPFVSCGEEEGVVEIPVLFRMDPQVNEADNLDLVQSFNEAYEGRYRVEVEWLVETESGYRSRIKQLNAVDKLPAVITDIGFDDKFLQMLIENHRLVDLAPYINDSSQWRSSIRDDIFEGMQEEDSSIFVSPLGNLMYSSAGIVYNKEKLARAGYDTFPDNWEDFFDCLEKLREQKETPLALHGAGNYWVPMLFSTAYCSGTEEGREFLRLKFPESYRNDTMASMMEFMKKLYGYSYEDALDIEYNEAEKRFFSGEGAIIANGSWMFMGLDEEEKSKYGFASFPGQMLVGSWEMTAWAAVSSQPEEVQEGAVEFLKFRTLKDQRDVEADIEGVRSKDDDTIMGIYKEQAWNVEELVPNYQINWEQEIINEYMITYVPQFIHGQISLEEYLMKMDQAAGDIRAEQ